MLHRDNIVGSMDGLRIFEDWTGTNCAIKIINLSSVSSLGGVWYFLFWKIVLEIKNRQIGICCAPSLSSKTDFDFNFVALSRTEVTFLKLNTVRLKTFFGVYFPVLKILPVFSGILFLFCYVLRPATCKVKSASGYHVIEFIITTGAIWYVLLKANSDTFKPIRQHLMTREDLD